ncbi:MAG: AAA family ATPase [Bacteroidetes bacterium]|nr:MAG: AAA family ATPase [Bacteroidota bacterium]
MPKYAFGETVKTGYELAVGGILMPYVKGERVEPVCRLWGDFWRRGELALLFGEQGVGKSALAVQIADAISRGVDGGGMPMECGAQKVVFCDVEHDVKVFERRCGGIVFDPNFIRVGINPLYGNSSYLGAAYFEALENTLKDSGARVLVIDSVTAIKNMACYDPKQELYFASRLRILQRKLDLSVLVVTDTQGIGHRGRLLYRHMAGVRYWAGFADSAFGMGFCGDGAGRRYLIQFKSTEGIVYWASNVLCCDVVSEKDFKGFRFTGTGREAELLQPPLGEPETSILKLKRENPRLSLRKIAERIGVSKMKVKRVLDKYGVKPL